MLSATIDGARLEISDALIAKHDRPLPRYTSYPPAPAWGPLGPDEYAAALRSLSPPGRGKGEGGLSLYLHIPFCGTKCVFCGCHSIATAHRGIMARYVRACQDELSLTARAAAVRPHVSQVHFGGGTPTAIGIDGIEALLDRLHHTADVEGEVEQAIELDPRAIGPGDIARLRTLGFNRMSFGIQDFDPGVNAIVGRMSDFEAVRGLIDAAREAGVAGINFDLIYGLPGQSADGWRHTLGQVVSLAPDRIAVFNFAYLPRALPHQRRIDPKLLPSGREKLALFIAAIERFQDAGYAFIGLDHFARAGDPLERAHRSGTLTRNFQGYSPGEGLPIVGIGATAISELGDLYAQNEKKLARHLARIESGRLATARGLTLTRDDLLRRSVIRSLMCRQRIDLVAFEAEWGGPLSEAIPDLTSRLEPLEKDGLVTISHEAIDVTPLGRVFLRSVAFAFDAGTIKNNSLYSKGI